MFVRLPVRTQIKQLGAVVLQFDATLKENFKVESDVTTHPVESMVDFTDHIVLKPNVLTVDAIMSETPLTLGASIQGLGTTVGASIGQAAGGIFGNGTFGQIGQTVTTLGGAAAGDVAAKSVGDLVDQKDSKGIAVNGVQRLIDTYKQLLATVRSKGLVDIQTGLSLYETYALKSFSIEKAQGKGRSIAITMTFQQVLIATSLVIQIPKKKTHGKQNKKGDVTTAVPDAPTQANSSLFYMGLKKVIQ